MRGGNFNFEKFLSYQALLHVLHQLGVIDQGDFNEGMFEPNPLIRGQSLFVDPFKD